MGGDFGVKQTAHGIWETDGAEFWHTDEVGCWKQLEVVVLDFCAFFGDADGA